MTDFALITLQCLVEMGTCKLSQLPPIVVAVKELQQHGYVSVHHLPEGVTVVPTRSGRSLIYKHNEDLRFWG